MSGMVLQLGGGGGKNFRKVFTVEGWGGGGSEIFILVGEGEGDHVVLK